MDPERRRRKFRQISNSPVLSMQDDFPALAQNPFGNCPLRAIVDRGAPNGDSQ
jgi:hypothetical protein